MGLYTLSQMIKIYVNFTLCLWHCEIKEKCCKNIVKSHSFPSCRCGRAINNYRSETCLDVTVGISLIDFVTGM